MLIHRPEEVLDIQSELMFVNGTVHLTPGMKLWQTNNSGAILYILMLYAHSISLKCGRLLNTHSKDFIRMYIEHVTSHKRKNRFVSCYEG